MKKNKEQRIKNKLGIVGRRSFILYSLLFIHCAEGAKLCVNTNISTALTQGDSWQLQNSINMFGTGCKSQTTTWAIDSTGATCIGRCTFNATTPCGTLILASIYRTTPGHEGQPTGAGHCQCKLVYPFVGEWITPEYNNVSATECGYKCTYVLQYEAYRNALLGL